MPYRILVIDDHPETLKVVSLILRREGFDVTTVTSGLEGIAAAEAQYPSLILLDVMMPGLDGYEVCRRFRAHTSLHSVPIIMFTAKIQIEDKWAGFEAGADDYLTKPTDPSELTARVQALLKRVKSNKVSPQESTRQETQEPLNLADPARKKPSRSRNKNPAINVAGTSRLPDKKENQRDGCLIAVMGARGGSGATTVAVNLAASLAQENCPTILVDLDMVQGHIAFYLNQKVQGGVNELAHLAGHELKEALHHNLVSVDNHWQLLLARPNLDQHLPLLSADQVISMIKGLVQPGRYIVVDVGRGMGSCGLPVIAQADRLLVCLQPDRVAMWSAQLLMRQLHGRISPHCTLEALLLDFGDTVHLPANAVEDFLRHPLLATIPIDRQEMAQVVNKGQALVRARPDSDTAAAFCRMSRELVKPVAAGKR